MHTSQLLGKCYLMLTDCLWWYLLNSDVGWRRVYKRNSWKCLLWGNWSSVGAGTVWLLIIMSHHLHTIQWQVYREKVMLYQCLSSGMCHTNYYIL